MGFINSMIKTSSYGIKMLERLVGKLISGIVDKVEVGIYVVDVMHLSW